MRETGRIIRRFAPTNNSPVSQALNAYENMSYDHEIESMENDVLTVAVQGWDESYVLWQKGLAKDNGADDGIYFEYDDQSNGCYNNVTECTVTSDGIHVVLTNSELVNFYFIKGFDKFAELKAGLEKIYQGREHVLESAFNKASKNADGGAAA